MTTRPSASPYENLPALDPASLNPPVNVILIQSVEQLQPLKEFLATSKEFVYDVETNVADAFTERKLRTIQIGDRNVQFVIDLLAFAQSADALRQQGGCKAPDWAQPIVEAIRPALESNHAVKVGMNLEFDYVQTAWCLGIYFWNVYDCLLAEKVIHCGRVAFYEKNFWALDDLVARYCKKRIDKSQQKTFDLESPLTEEQVMYAGLDVRLPLAVKTGQKGLISAAKLERVVQIENDALPAFGDMHLNGMYLDTDAWLKILDNVEEKHKENVNALDNYFVPVVGSKNNPPISPLQVQQIEILWRSEKDRVRRAEYRKEFQAANKKLREWEKSLPDCEGEALINYASNPQLLQTLRKMGYGERKLPSTDNKVLALLEGDPVIDALRAYRTTAKQKSTYGKNWLGYVNPVTGRVHSRFHQIGAVTGRTSSTNPNTQNIDNDTDYRSAFKARTGYKISGTDMAGAELRILAELSGDPIMIEAFGNGWDLHSVGAEIIFPEWKTVAEPGCAYYEQDHKKCECKSHAKLRKKVKALNFGIVFGKEAKSLSEELGISEDEAKTILERWRSAFKVAWAFLVKIGNETKVNLTSRTIAGRIRYYKKPDWDECKVAAMERLGKRGKNPLTVTSRDITRVYHGRFGKIEREGRNHPMQGSNCDIAKICMGTATAKDGEQFLWHQLRKYEAKLIGFVHDEILVETPEDHAQDVAQVVGDAIIRAGKELMSKVTMDYEGGVEDYWCK